MRKFLITMMCIIMVVCFMPTVAMAGETDNYVARIGDKCFETLSEAINAANSAEGEEKVTVEIIKSGEYEPFTITRSNAIVQAADGVTVTIKVNSSQKFAISARTNVTLKDISFVSSDGTSIIYGGGGDNLFLSGCSFINNSGNAGGTALYIHEPNISIEKCAFKNWERGYYTCSDNHSAEAMTFTGNTFTNVRVPIDGYWGRYKTDATDIQITGNTFDSGNWDATYIQLWDYAQYGHYCNWETNKETGTAINATVRGNNFVDGKGVLYLTHFDWFEESVITIDNNNVGMKTVRRNLVELTGRDNDLPVTLKNVDGTSITAFNENISSNDRGPGNSKKAIYAISAGDYLISVTKDGVTQDFPITVKQTEGLGQTQTYEVKAPKAAKINETEYATLEDAIQNVTDGQTVTLLGDVKLGATITIDKNITIDLNTHTISSNEVGSAIFQNDGQISLLMKNGSIINNSDGKVFYWVADGELTLANVRVTAEEARAIQIEDNAEVIIDKDSIVTGNDYSIYMRSYNETQKPTLHVYGKVSCINSEAIATKGSTPVINIYEGANIISDAWTAIYFQNPVVLNISGGTLRGGNEMTIIGEDFYTDDEDNEIYYPIGLHENSSISGGYFYGGILLSENTKQFISGGRFSHSYLIPKFAVKDRYVSKESIANDAMYLVHEHSTCNFGHTYCPATCKDENGVEMCHTLSHYVAPPTTPTTPTDNVTNSGTSGTDNATTSADLSGSTSTSNGTTSSTVDKTTADKIVDKAVENKSTEVVIDATANTTTAANSTTIAQVTIPTETLGAIAEKTEADVTIKTDVAEVKLDNTSAAAVSEQAEGDTVQIIAEKVKEDATEVHFELKVVCSDGKVISDFKGGNVAVTVALPKEMAEKKLVCVYIDDNGHMSKMVGQKNADGTYTFNTGHFSSYVIMAEEEADAAIAAQKEAIKNIKIKLTSKQVKTKAGKKAVKITWTAAAGDKVLDGVEVFRSTERYKGYGTKPFYTSTKGGNTGSYTNTKSLKKGTKYYYRVRGYVLVNGEKVYTDYSTKAWRTV